MVVVVAAAAEELVVVVNVVCATAEEVAVAVVDAMVVSLRIAVATEVFETSEERTPSAEEIAFVAVAEDALEMALAAADVAVEMTFAAAEEVLWTEAETEMRGMRGMGMCVGMPLIVVRAEVATDAAEGALEIAIVAMEAALDTPVSKMEAGFVAEPATLAATTASWDAAELACEATEAASDAAEETAVGVGATMLMGAIVTEPIGIDAVAGISMEVVNPWITTGTMAPGASDDTPPKTRAPEGMLSAMEVTSGGGPVTVKM